MCFRLMSCWMDGVVDAGRQSFEIDIEQHMCSGVEMEKNAVNDELY